MHGNVTLRRHQVCRLQPHFQSLQRALRFVDIRWAKHDKTFFGTAAAGEIDVFDIHVHLRETLGNHGQHTRLIRGFDHEHLASSASTPASPKSMSALVGSLTTLRTQASWTVSE